MGLKVADLTAFLGLDMGDFKTGVEKSLKLLDSLEGGAKAASVPIAALGAAALAAGLEFDAAFDKIALRTDKTGAELEDLHDSFRKVFVNVPASADQVSSAIAGISTRLGLTKAPLENLTTLLIELSRLTGTDVSSNIRSATRLFNEWGIAVDDQERVLTEFFVVSKKTGIGVDELLQAVGRSGALFREMGFNTTEAAVILGNLEKNGLNAEAMMTGLGRGLARLAKAGQDPKEVLGDLISYIQNTEKSGEGLRVAVDVLGPRIGRDLANAAKKGLFDIAALTTGVKESTVTIRGAAKDTDDFAEMFHVLKNKVSSALEPLGTELIKAINSLVPAMTVMVDILDSVVKWFVALPPVAKDATIALIGVASALTGAMGLNAALGVLGVSLGVLSGPVGLAVVAALALAAGAAFMVMRAGARDANAEVERLNKVAPGAGDQLKYLTAQLDRTIDPEKRAKIKAMIDELSKMEAPVASATGAVKLGALGMEAFGKAADKVKKVTTNFITPNEQKAIDALTKQLLDFGRSDAEKFLAGVSEQFKTMGPNAKSAAAGIARQIAAIMDMIAAGQEGEDLANQAIANVAAQLKAREDLVTASIALSGTAEAVFEDNLFKETTAALKAFADQDEMAEETYKGISDVYAAEAKKREKFARDQWDAESKATSEALDKMAGMAETEAGKVERSARDTFNFYDMMRANGLMGEKQFNDAVQRLREETNQKLKASYQTDFNNRVAALQENTAAVQAFYESEANAALAARAKDISEGQALLQTKIGWLTTVANEERDLARLHTQLLAVEKQEEGDFFGFLGANFQLVIQQASDLWENSAKLVTTFVDEAKSTINTGLFEFWKTGTVDMGKLFEAFTDTVIKAVIKFLVDESITALLKFAKPFVSSLGGLISSGISGVFGKAKGGFGDDRQPVGSGDIIPTLLSPDELVLNPEQVGWLQRLFGGGVSQNVLGEGRTVFGSETLGRLFPRIADFSTNYALGGGGGDGILAGMFGLTPGQADAARSASGIGGFFGDADAGTKGLFGSGGLEANVGSVAGLGATGIGLLMSALSDSKEVKIAGGVIAAASPFISAAAQGAFAAAQAGTSIVGGAVDGASSTATSGASTLGVWIAALMAAYNISQIAMNPNLSDEQKAFEALGQAGIAVSSIYAGPLGAIAATLVHEYISRPVFEMLGFGPSKQWLSFGGRLGETLNLEQSSANALSDDLTAIGSRAQLSPESKTSTLGGVAAAIQRFEDSVSARVGGFGQGNGPFDIAYLPGATGTKHEGGQVADFGPMVNSLQASVDRILGFYGGSRSSVPSFDGGGLARLHDGEVVTPRPFALEFPALSRSLARREFSGDFAEPESRARARSRTSGDLRIGPLSLGDSNLGTLVIKDFRRRDAAGDKFLPSSVIFERNRS